ncbi:MAG: hypothetical protein K6F80_06245 [Oscillospiraceae bacterium]|nr:hypothetical protein [Oscillospiraceae bacterium]
MDHFAEQLVKKINTGKDNMKRALIIAAAILLSLLSVILTLMGYPLALILPVCAVWAAWYFLRMQNVEYEYSCTNGELDIDKILGQDKRKPMLSVNVGSFTIFGKAGQIEETDADMTTFSAMGLSLMGEEDENDNTAYYAEFDHPEHGKCCLYFNPDARMREAMEPYFSRDLRRRLGGKL